MKFAQLVGNCTWKVFTNFQYSHSSQNLHEIATKTKGNDAAQMPMLKCFIENGRFNYELLASCLELRNQQQDERQCQLMGLAIVVQFMSKQVSRDSL